MPMRQTTSQILFEYWNEVRGGRVAPRRFEIEPARLTAVLSETFLVERLAPGRYAYRLAGTRICDQLGEEMRGLPLLDGFAESDRQTVIRQLEGPVTGGAALVLQLGLGDTPGRLVRFEALVLPLVHTGSAVSRFLGAMSAIDPPAWLGTRPLPHRTLAGFELVWPETSPAHEATEKADELPPLRVLPNARVVRAGRRMFRILDGGQQR